MNLSRTDIYRTGYSLSFDEMPEGCQVRSWRCLCSPCPWLPPRREGKTWAASLAEETEVEGLQ